MAIGSIFGGKGQGLLGGLSSDELARRTKAELDRFYQEGMMGGKSMKQPPPSSQSIAPAHRYGFPHAAARGDTYADPGSGNVYTYDGASWIAISGQSGTYPGKNGYVGIDYVSQDAICFRLRITPGELRAKGIELCHVRQVGEDIHVVVGHGQQTIVMTDGATNFPSDEFIAKLRLLL